MAPGDHQCNIAQTIDLGGQATDPDGERLRYTVTGLPNSVVISESKVIPVVRSERTCIVFRYMSVTSFMHLVLALHCVFGAAQAMAKAVR